MAAKYQVLHHMRTITKAIIGSSFTVINNLGHGILEKVYENALAHELRLNGLHVEQQVAVRVYYKNKRIGKYIMDLLVEDQILVEVKAVSILTQIHVAQVINYLKATDYTIGLLINFGNPRLEFRRLGDIRKS